jgi:cytochrome P450
MRGGFPPGPKGHWWSGSLADYAGRRLDFLTECARSYGDISSFRVGRRRVVLINDSGMIERMLVTDARSYAKHFGLRFYEPLVGRGLLLAEGEEWIRQRRLVQPAFHRQRLAGYAPVITELTARATAGWKEGERRDLHDEMMRLTGLVTLKTLFDSNDVDGSREFDRAHAEVLDLLLARLRRLLRPPLWLPTGSNTRIRAALRQMDVVLDRLITRGQQDGEGLLARILNAGTQTRRELTHRLVRDQVMTLFIAGRETTALALSWGWYLLADHPTAERRLADEWQTVLGGRSPTIDDLPNLTYTGHVVSESMRLYPPAQLIGREAIRRVELGGYSLPAGTTVFASQWVTHRDPRFFKDPDTFRPERWGGGLAEQLPKFAYFPFGGGPRVCIGNAFALMEAILVFATVGQRWRFRLAPDARVEPWPGMTLRPRYGVSVILSKRLKPGEAFGDER